MAKNKFADYDATAGNNTDMGGIDIQGTSNVENFDNALREFMAQVAENFASADVASATTADIGAQAAHYINITGTTTITGLGTIKAGTLKFVKFAGALTLTHNGTSLILPGATNITTAAGDTAVFVSEGSGNWRCLGYQRAGTDPARHVTRGYIYGLTLSNNSTDATNDINIAAGEAASDDDPPVLMRVSSGPLIKRLDASWAVGTNEGGLDTGTIADTTYHVWLIRRSDTGVVDALFSTSASSPTMPTNYDQKRRIGAIVRTSGVIRQFQQFDDHFIWDSPPLDIDVTNQGTTVVTRTLTVPAGVRTRAQIRYLVSNASAVLVLFREPGADDDAPSSGAAPLADVLGPSGQSIIGNLSVFTNAASAIRTRASLSSTTLRIVTVGWVDTRGKDG